MRLAIIESPYASKSNIEAVRLMQVRENEHYARRLMSWAFAHGFAPYASHLLYTQPGVLDDRIASERTLGIEAGLAWGRCASISIVGLDLGISTGMSYGIRRAALDNREIRYVMLDSDLTYARLDEMLREAGLVDP